jgi:hypothetical protein
MINSNDTTGNRSATFRFVAQCLNNCATACPLYCQVWTELPNTLIIQITFTLSIVPCQTLHSFFHLNNTSVRRTSGRNLRPCKQSTSVSHTIGNTRNKITSIYIWSFRLLNMEVIYRLGHSVAQLLRDCATNRKVARSIPTVSWKFSFT